MSAADGSVLSVKRPISNVRPNPTPSTPITHTLYTGQYRRRDVRKKKDARASFPRSARAGRAAEDSDGPLRRVKSRLLRTAGRIRARACRRRTGDVCAREPDQRRPQTIKPGTNARTHRNDGVCIFFLNVFLSIKITDNNDGRP